MNKKMPKNKYLAFFSLFMPLLMVSDSLISISFEYPNKNCIELLLSDEFSFESEEIFDNPINLVVVNNDTLMPANSFDKVSIKEFDLVGRVGNYALVGFREREGESVDIND